MHFIQLYEPSLRRKRPHVDESLASATLILTPDYCEQERVVCEASETTTIEAFRSWGFKPIPVPFRHFLPFGKSFESLYVEI